MKYIVRIVTEEAFKGLVTGYVGPFDTSDEARAYADDIDAFHHGEAEAYVEDLHANPDDFHRDAGDFACAECGTTSARTYVVTTLDHADPKHTRTEICSVCHDRLQED